MTRLVPTWGRCLATSGQNGAELQAEAAKRADGYGSGLDIYRSESGLYNICIKGTTFGERALCLTDRPSDKTDGVCRNINDAFPKVVCSHERECAEMVRAMQSLGD